MRMTGFAFTAAATAWSRADAGDGERNDLHGGDHLAFDHRLVGRQRRYRDRFIDPVERIDRLLVDQPERRRFRQKDCSGR